VVGAVWYQRNSWQQHHELQMLKALDQETEEELRDAQANKDRRQRKVLLVESESLGVSGFMWQIEYALDISHARVLLQEADYDLVVLPLCDGAGLFLRWVAERNPTLCRAVQCEANSPIDAFSAAPDAHLFLRADSPPEVLHEQLIRGTALNTRAIEAALTQHLGSLANLPALPATYARVQTELARPHCSIDRVGDIIGRDLGLGAKVLQLVNAALINTRQPVVQIEHAVKLVGLRGIRDLTLSVEVLSELSSAAPHLRQVLSDSHLRSLRAAKLAHRVAGGGAEADDAYSACLFHDIGKITLMVHAAEAYAQVQMLVNDSEESLEDIEMQILGVTHHDVSAYLLRLWGLPQPVVEAVQFWQDPTLLDHDHFGPVDATYVALNLVKAFESGDIRNATLDVDLLTDLHRIRALNRWQIHAASICEEIQILPPLLTPASV